jgi:hypothetical protein
MGSRLVRIHIILPVSTDNHKSKALPLPPVSDLDLECPDVKPKMELPVGSKSQKRWYFFDTKRPTRAFGNILRIT